MSAVRIDTDALARTLCQLDDDDIVDFATAVVLDLTERDPGKLVTLATALDQAMAAVSEMMLAPPADPAGDPATSSTASALPASGEETPAASLTDLTPKGDDIVH